MKRFQLENLANWLNSPGRKPLVIRGARQVGKSTLVRLFAEQCGRPLIEVNLERFPQLHNLFDSMSPRDILNQIEALPHMKAVAEDAILFLDEIQAAPKAIPALRYFHEEMSQRPVLSAGSLLEFTLANHNFSMPVGRIQYLHMGPMTFLEFLEALGEKKLQTAIETYSLEGQIGPVVHQRLLELLRSYYFVGGMPEAVNVFSKDRRYADVSAVHNSIIETYRDDFPKYAGSRDLTRLLHVFNFVARNVGIKIKYSNISSDEHSATLKRDIELLCMARVVTKVVHTHASGLPLQADLNPRSYKLLFLDVGLMNALCGLNWHTLANLADSRLINEGAIAEQFIGQHLQALNTAGLNRDLTYWLREGRANNAEIDFMESFDGKIVPIEVKSGASGTLRSLHQFAGEKQTSLAVRFDANLPTVQNVSATIQTNGKTSNVKYQLLSLPLYMVERLPQLLRHFQATTPRE
jgi:uncharacterized protein